MQLAEMTAGDLTTLLASGQTSCVDIMRSVRELAGGAFQAVPSSEQSFLSAETREDTERYYPI